MNKKYLLSTLIFSITVLSGCNDSSPTSNPNPSPPPSPNYPWISQVGASGGDTYGNGTSTDGNGNIYIVGYTTVGINEQNQNGIYDYFLSKYKSNGTLEWGLQLGGNQGYTYANAVNADNNNIYVAGGTSVGLDQQTQNGTQDSFLGSYDVNGNLLWLTQLGANGGDTYAMSISNQSSNIAIAGTTSVALSGNTQYGSYDYFISQYNAVTGSLISTIQDGASFGTTGATGITKRDNNGNFYVTGYTTQGLDGQTQQGSTDAFITQYNSSDNRVWTRQLGNTLGSTVALGITIDNNGNAYIAGWTNVSIDGQTAYGYRDYFISKYSSSGVLIWTRELGAISGYTIATAISLTSNGDLCVSGTTDAGLNGQTQHGDTDYFISYFTIDGALLATVQNGDTQGHTNSSGISTDQNGNVYLAGSTTVGLGGQSQNGNYDYFLAKYVYNSGS